MKETAWIDMEDAIRDQLALQVELSFDRHHEFMLKHGLARCRDAVDVGTGNGLFLGRVAMNNPAIRFHGIDNKPHMIEEARERDIRNVHWVQADALDPITRTMLGSTNGILMRYFLLHMPNTSDSLSQMLAEVKPGTRLWIFDLDTDHSRCEPYQAEYESFRDIVRRFCEQNSVETRAGTVLPPILETLGLAVEEVAVEPFNNQAVDPSRFAEYLYREAMLYHYFMEGTDTSDTLTALKHFLCDVMDHDLHFVQYGMIMISAVKRPSSNGHGAEHP